MAVAGAPGGVRAIEAAHGLIWPTMEQLLQPDPT